MATSEQETTKRPLPQEEVHSSDLKEAESASKKQKLDGPPADPMQPDSTEVREEAGSSDESVDLEGESDGDGDSDELEEGKGGKGNGEEFDESHSGDPLEGDDDDSDLDGEGSGDESEEELPIIEGQEVELVKGAAEAPTDGANNVDAGSYLLRGKQGRVLKLAISETAISEIHNECLSLFDSGRLPHIRASDLEIISDTEAELTVHASTVGVSTSYLARQYSEEEVAALLSAGGLPSHLLAEEKDWCVIEVEGFPALFGSRDLMAED